MSSLETYVMRIKPAIDGFIQMPSKETLRRVELEIKEFDFGQMRIFQVQILVPLVIKLDELSGENQELRTGLLDCLRHIVSKLYLSDEKGLRSILVVVLQQIRNSSSADMRPNLSEEIKLAAVLCITESLRRSTSDVLEAFYTEQTAMIIGQILLTLLELIAQEKYRKLVNAALQCLMVVFYVHDAADAGDVVLRNQVANITFIFLPKVVTVLYKTAIADDKQGESIKSNAVRALGRIICIMFEETSDELQKTRYDLHAFQALFHDQLKVDDHQAETESNIFGSRKPGAAQMEERLKQLQTELRSPQWLAATSQRLRPIFSGTSILRAHTTIAVREAYAEMCCLLLHRCGVNLKHNFMPMLESLLALSEDEHDVIAQSCRQALLELQQLPNCAAVFDEHAELLLDAHLQQWPRVLHRCDDQEQFAALLFFKGFLRQLSAQKLQLLLLVPKNLELFVSCLLAALDLRITRDLLHEEYSLRHLQENSFKDLRWRQFKHLSSERCVHALYEISALLGAAPALNRLIFDYCQQLLEQRSAAMNEIILLLTLMIAAPPPELARESRLMLAQLLLNELLKEEHWHLALKPDKQWRLKKAQKHSSWLEQRTPGLYESAVEVRTQDCDSDDDESAEAVKSRVSIMDAQFNVLHTCLVMDSVAHCAQFMGDCFDRHIFRSLHQVLLKLASSNSIVHAAASFAFLSMQQALKYKEPSQFIECSTDYISYHLNALLKRAPDSSAAVDILTVVLQFSTRNNVPHLDSIFQTISEECAKRYQLDNVHSYLRVFHAFLRHVEKWQRLNVSEINAMQTDELVEQPEQQVLDTWLTVLNKTPSIDENPTSSADIDMDAATNEPEIELEKDEEPLKSELPRHIAMARDICSQVVKFVSSAEQTQQILALECLASGVPLLADYENELLPLVHLIWQPLVEKFRQRDALVLNRCFSLLHLLGLHAKEFLLKRSLSDVMPQLKQFLKLAAAHSSAETSSPLVQTQEYKLQLKLLRCLAEFAQSLQLEGKHLHELLNIVALYLSKTQPQEFQLLALQFYRDLVNYNGPFVYVTMLQRAHLREYKDNVSNILASMGFGAATETSSQLSELEH